MGPPHCSLQVCQLLQMRDQPILRLFERRQRHTFARHAGEFAREGGFERLFPCEQYFMNRSVVACEVRNEAVNKRGVPAELLEHLHHVEDIAGVLTIQGRDEFASVEFRGVENRQNDVSCELLLCCIGETSSPPFVVGSTAR